MTEYIQVTTAIDSKEQAQRLAETLVTNRLAACAHVSGPITSTYWWQGRMEVAEEWICEAKTRRDLYKEMETILKSLHPYDEPEIIATPILTGSESYLKWILTETKGA